MFLVEPQVVDLLRHCPNAEDALRPVIDLQLHILQGENPAEGDDRGTKCATGGKRTVRPGDIGHQEDIGEWQGGHRRGYSKDHSGRSFIGIHPVSLLSDNIRFKLKFWARHKFLYQCGQALQKQKQKKRV